MYDYLIAGAGLTGCVIAERLARVHNKSVLIVEKRNHIGGNVYDEYDNHGILINRYGPHIFHTNITEVFEYLSHFTEWRFYEHRVMVHIGEQNLPLPVNRITLNSLYNLSLLTCFETLQFLNSIRSKRYPILNSEDIIINKLGNDIFQKIFRPYTIKQWGMEPKELSPEICGRIPVRTNADCRYFTDKYQFMPKEGYTKMFERMLHHKGIELALNCDFSKISDNVKFKKIIFTGPIDNFFDYEFGRLKYRSIQFEYEFIESEHYQECAQINYMNDYPYTRIIEHKYISNQAGPFTVISREYPKEVGEEYYPVLNELNIELYKIYNKRADSIRNLFFCGRLAQFKYFNMDQTVKNALNFVNKII